MIVKLYEHSESFRSRDLCFMLLCAGASDLDLETFDTTYSVSNLFCKLVHIVKPIITELICELVNIVRPVIIEN